MHRAITISARFARHDGRIQEHHVSHAGARSAGSRAVTYSCATRNVTISPLVASMDSISPDKSRIA